VRVKTLEVRMSADEYRELVQAADQELRSPASEARHRIRQTLRGKSCVADRGPKAELNGEQTPRGST
jgi:hypothetical protein